jgi:hypothetical protein
MHIVCFSTETAAEYECFRIKEAAFAEETTMK